MAKKHGAAERRGNQRGNQKSQMKSISSVFFKYVCFYMAGVLFWMFLLFLLWFLLDVTGRILPANHMEAELNESADEIRKTNKVTEEMMPGGCLYGVYGSDGEWLYGTFPGEEIRKAWENYERNDIYARGKGYYRFFVLDSGQVCIVKYKIATGFQNRFLDKYLPDPDILIVMIFIVLFLIHTVLVSRHFGKYMKKRLFVLNEVTERLRNHDLEFEEEHSGLKEVEEVLNSLNQMKEALKESLHRQWNLEKSREEQIAALAHDIKTPLTVIRGNAELLAEGELTEEEREYDRDILQSASMMEEYLTRLNELLAEDMPGEIFGAQKGKYGAWDGSFGMPEESFQRKGTFGAQKEKSCESLTELLLEQARLLSSARLHPVIFHREELYGELWCDEHQILRAFNNVLSNAMDYSPPKGRIEISMDMRTEDDREYLALSVTDEGPGFTAQDLRHAAEQFYQGDLSRSSKSHYGIGLHTAEKFVKAQGGRLVLENAQPHGARVTMLFLIHI